MSTLIDILKLRKPAIEYVSPPICEVVLSGSGFPDIDLTPFGILDSPGPLKPPDYPDDPNLTFPNIPGVICYTIYKALDALDPFGAYEIVAECLPPCCCERNVPGCTDCSCDPDPTACTVFCWVPEEFGCYKVSAITPQGETPLSAPLCIFPPVVITEAGSTACA